MQIIAMLFWFAALVLAVFLNVEITRTVYGRKYHVVVLENIIYLIIVATPTLIGFVLWNARF